MTYRARAASPRLERRRRHRRLVAFACSVKFSPSLLPILHVDICDVEWTRDALHGVMGCAPP